MTFRVVLECDPESGDFSAVCPELPGCASAGETEAEARANIGEAIELYLSNFPSTRSLSR
jgi:predicted RNase H-like HicB family nuclease